MVIDKVHGLQATNISLNDRFTFLAAEEPVRVPVWQKRRAAVGNFVGQNVNYVNRNLIGQIARKLEQQSKRIALNQRLGVGGGRLRRYGSEGHLPGLCKWNSFGNLNQERSVKSRIGWKQSNGNLSRSASFSNLSGVSWGSWSGGPLRGFRKRNGSQRPLRVRFSGKKQNLGWVNRISRGERRGAGAGAGAMSNRGVTRGQSYNAQPNRGGSGARGGILRNQGVRLMLTKEELDAQLEQYMSGTKAALDKELDAYMREAIDTQ